MNASEAGGDLALIQTSLLFSCKYQLVSREQLDMHNKNSEACIKTRSTPASLPIRSQATRLTTVKWSVVFCPSKKLIIHIHATILKSESKNFKSDITWFEMGKKGL